MKKLLLFIIVFTISYPLLAQSNGDYRSKTSEDWSSKSTWQIYDGTKWDDLGFFDSAPGSTVTSTVTIQNGHTVTYTDGGFFVANNLTVDGGGSINIENGGELIVQGGLLSGNTSLIINNGGSITVSGQLTCTTKFDQMKVSGDFTINTTGTVDLTKLDKQPSGTLLIKSDGTSTGSLIFDGVSSNDPEATVERYVKYGRWNMVSPSTTDVTAYNFYDASGNSSWLTVFDEATGTDGSTAGTGWSFLTNLNTAINVAQGYCYWPTIADETVSFSGNLRYTDTTLSLNFTDSDHGYNLIGNPFSSALEWDSSWTKTNVESSIWIWNGTQYEALPSELTNHDIAVGQGFFVRAEGSSPSITVPEGKRVHNNTSFLKNSRVITDNDFNYLIINALNNQYNDRAFIYFDENGTDAYDDGYDATKMFGSADAPQIYLKEGYKKQTYDFLPDIQDNDSRTVPLGYIPGADGNQILSFDLSNFKNIDVVLEDLQTGNNQNILENNVYEFDGSKDDDPARFLLHFTRGSTGVADVQTENNVNIYSYSNNIYVQLSADITNERGQIFVYDITGRELLTSYIQKGETLKRITLNNHSGYVVVKVVVGPVVKTSKVFIK